MLEDAVLERVDAIVEKVDTAAELDVIRYAAKVIGSSSEKLIKIFFWDMGNSVIEI